MTPSVVPEVVLLAMDSSIGVGGMLSMISCHYQYSDMESGCRQNTTFQHRWVVTHIADEVYVSGGWVGIYYHYGWNGHDY